MTVPGAGASADPATEPVSAVVQVAVPAPRMLVFGAGSFAAPLVAAGRLVGYRVTLCDARAAFATADGSRTPTRWSWTGRTGTWRATAVDARTVICSLVHDPKFEIPLLVEALRSPAGYVGALGSRRTHAKRVEALRREGLGEDEIARLRAPIGLDLGADHPGGDRDLGDRRGGRGTRGRSGRELRGTSGRIHRESP